MLVGSPYLVWKRTLDFNTVDISELDALEVYLFLLLGNLHSVCVIVSDTWTKRRIYVALLVRI